MGGGREIENVQGGRRAQNKKGWKPLYYTYLLLLYT